MFIKAVTKKGIAIPYTAEESLKKAIEYGVKTKNTPDFIYYLHGDVTKDTFSSHNDKEKNKKTGKMEDVWYAQATGTCMVGRVCTKRSKFFVEKKYSYKIGYKSDKDEVGIPDIKVTSFEFTLLDSNPSNIVGELPKNPKPKNISGEIKPEKTKNILTK